MMVLKCTIPFEIMAEQKITIWFFIYHLITPCFVYSLAAEEGNKGYGPVFEEQPIDTIYPEESSDGQVSMNCRARAVPFPTYRWKLNNWDIDLTKERYSMVGGRLVINNPEKSRDAGKYVCVVSNIFGTVRSSEATLSFGYLDPFPPEERYEVKVREGVGAVLLCEPPYHYPDDLSYRWLLNEFPVFIALDKRRFVSQTNGNLYIANVEASDKGNYSCFVSSPSITKSVFSKFIPLIPQSDRAKVYPADIKVKFKDTYALLGQNVTLECFALGNPVPELRWSKYLEPLPASAEISMSGAVLKIFNIQYEDEGLYECEAENYKGKDKHQARVYVQAAPEWVEHINDTERDIGSDLYWPCVATGKPIPTIRWLKNGASFRKGELRMQSLTFDDAGMYQCIAENMHGIIYANAELKIVASPPTFEPRPKRAPAARRARVAAAAPDALPLRPLRCPTGGAMASRKSSRATGGSPSPGSKRETKHGGSKNGKKEGLSGSSFFTWFMVIALLGVWTSVAVVWFELVDYEEVLAKAKDFRYNLSEVLQGKLGIYDADGDGDFDVEDAKVLLGLKERSVPAQPTPESEETVQPAEKSYVESEHKTADIELEEEIQSVLREALHSHPGERHEDVDESVSDHWQAKEETHGETFEAPATDDMLREFETEIPEAYETPDSVQKDADPMVEDIGAVESEPYEIPALDDYVADLEERVSDSDTPGDSEIMPDDTMEHYAEDRVHEDYSEDQGIESKQTEDDVAIEPEESEKPVKAEDYSDDVQVGKSEKETEQDKTEQAKKKKKPKLLNKFDKTIKAELDAAEKLRKKGKVEEALRAFEALVNRYPQSPRARYGKAQSEDDLAEKMRSNEMLQQAINTYDEVVSLPNVPSDLIKLSLKREADRQQFLGRMRGSLVTLQKLVQLFPSETSFKNDLGVGYLLIGDNSNAKKVYEEVLSLAPNDGFAKVHYGFILKAENKIAESIPYLQEGLESGDPGTDDGRFYFHLGDALQRMGDKEAYKWYELGYQRGHFASVWQRSLYNVKGLKAQPWWTARETGYTELVKSLEKNWKLIRDEGLAVMDKKQSLFLPEDENLREKGDWSQFTLWQQGRKNENACKSVPKTCALLERFPEATGCRRGQIKYSIMHPGTHVWPHTGPTNCRLRMHLGLVIPKEGCRIRCAQEDRDWEEGKVLIFDDSFEHEVWQDAESYRLIFIVDVWHPELTAQQRRTLPAI